MYKEELKKILDEIKSHADKRFGVTKATSPFIYLNRFEGTAEAKQELVFTADESSHPGLDKSITTINVTVELTANSLNVIFGYPIDRVDVDYCRYDKRTNQRNITIGRKFNRKVVKWFRNQMPKKIEKKSTPSKLLVESLMNSIALENENAKLLTTINKIHGDVVPNKYTMRRPRPDHGFIKEGRVYYHGSTKVGIKSKVKGFIKENIHLLVDDFRAEYPLNAELKRL